MSTQRCVGRIQKCIDKGYADVETYIDEDIVRKASKSPLPTREWDVFGKGTWVECAKREVEHYYELCRKKHEVASNKNNPYSSGSRKLIRKRGAENDKIENRTDKS
ncbi:uncharacterized protein E6C27_scaffold113G00420 [Cucumis melo var. makuwa]|uniref:Uncharacterized protein n=1 Tax=Cucumis melo var. makuwa TaxID=1194695 RepID=A0A5A7T963_CUCMM|nr:uncharacterized protein E6C27_scaffold113G00420 [Cucumis melo var. makuwa]